MNLWNTIKQYISETQESDTLVDEVPQYAGARKSIDAYLHETRGRHYWNIKVREIDAAKTILQAEPEFQIAALLAALSVSTAARRRSSYEVFFQLRPLVSALTRRALPYSDLDVLRLVQMAPKSDDREQRAIVRIAAERSGNGSWLSEPLRAALEAWAARPTDPGADAAKTRIQLLDMLAGRKRAPLLVGEPWADGVLSDLAAAPPAESAHWCALLSHAMGSDAPRPSAKWLKQARPLVEAVGSEAFVTRVTAWAALFAANHFPPYAGEAPGEHYREWTRLSTLLVHNYAALKGLAWCCRLIEGDAVPALLGDLADNALRKIPGHGPKSAKVGNACILTLGAMSGMVPVAQLSRLKRRVKYAASQGVIETALLEAATRAGLPPEDLEELATPAFGLDRHGRRREELGDCFADLAVTPAGHVDLTWTDKEGRALKSAPLEVKKNHADTLKELKQATAEIGKTLTAVRARLEGCFLTDRSWTLADWRERCIDHPLTGILARRLIWRFTDGERSALGMWSGGALVDETGQALAPLSENAAVRLWHPLESTPEAVLAWRRRLETHGVSQPFKQAHREIYLLTDAEIGTGTYSNRFAAHILRQHQFHALCRERGWSYQLQGGFDGGNTPTLTLPRHDLRVEFWVEPTDLGALSDSGIHLHVSTDQVRFYNSRGRSTAAGRRSGAIVQRDPARRRSVRRRLRHRRRSELAKQRRPADARRLLESGFLRGPDRRGANAPRCPQPPDPALENRRPVRTRRPVPARSRLPARLQDPSRKRKYSDGAERPVPLHRPRPPQGRFRGLPPI